MLLTDQEIADLTRKRRHPAQAAQLRVMNIAFKQRADGSLVVLRAHVEHLLGGVAPSKVQDRIEPNFEAINA